MTKRELLAELRAEISPEEEALLRAGEGLSISAHNRAAALEILTAAPEEGGVPEGAPEKLKAVLVKYLAEMLPEKPEAWKWILLGCEYLSFIAERPMHDLKTAGITVRREAGKTAYYCLLREPSEEVSCHFCVCRPMPEGEA